MSQSQLKTFFVALAFIAGLNFIFIVNLKKTPCKETPKLRRIIGHNLNVSKRPPKTAPKTVPKIVPKIVPKPSVRQKHLLLPFTHKEPIFLSKKDAQIFMMQPENIDSMESDWVKEWSYKNCYEEGHDQYYAILKGGEGWSFQHWFDNLYPRIWQIYKEKKDVIAVIDHPRDKILYDLWSALGFEKLIEEVPKRQAQMKTCIYPRNSQIRAHPDMIRDLRQAISINNNPVSGQLKVVWIHRSNSSTHNGGRFVTNENELRNAIEAAGFEFVLFSGTNALASGRATFNNSYAIVGVHGGGMYNQYFASKYTKIIELMPVKPSGLLHSQRSSQDIPRLAHRCIWHNANLIGQPYIRVHVKTPTIQRFEAPVDKIVQALSEV